MTLAFAVVPPMSNEIRFGRPSWRPASAAAITPAAGPDSTTTAGRRSASAMSNTPPDDPITCSAGSPRSEAAALQPVEIGPQQRPDIGADGGGAGAFELADFRQHLAGQIHGHIGQRGTQRGADAALMRVVEKGEQQRNGDGLQAGGTDGLDQRRQFVFRQRRDDGALGIDRAR